MRKRAFWRRLSSMDYILWVYLWILMVGLFLQGSGSLVLRLSSQLEAITPPLLAGILLAHIPHAIVHIVWGLSGILMLTTVRTRQARLWLGLIFGVFYTLLAIYGSLNSYAYGLNLAPSEDAFHWIVGPLTLGLSLLDWYTQSRSSRPGEELPSSRSGVV